MPSPPDVSASQKPAYQRPYKTRGQRREIARHKHDENVDHKFLIRAVIAIGLLLLVAMGMVVKSWTDRVVENPSAAQALR